MKYKVARVLLLAWAGALWAVVPGKFRADLWQELQGAGEKDIHKAIVLMAETPDFSGFAREDRVGRLHYLKDLARRSQTEVLTWLGTLPADQVRKVQSFWIVNGFYIEATKAVLYRLSDRADVRWIEKSDLNWIIEPERSAASKTPPRVNTVEWNIAKIKADSVWYQYGIHGEGVLLGNLDTGVDVTHPGLSSKWSGYWLDGVNGQPTPYDDHGHGTHTMGTMVGGDGPGPDPNDVGVAYGAQFAACKGFSSGGFGEDPWILACYQFFADLIDSGANIRIVSNSWGSSSTTDLTFWDATWNWRQLGIIPVFANGNSGPTPGTAGTPGNFPIVIGVGATDINDNIASFSSRGPAPNQPPWSDPTYWSRPDWNFIKPDISAPGVNIRSTVPGGGYESDWSGTSMATPHVAGVIALMLSLNPTLDYTTIYDILTNYGVDQPPQGGIYPNNDYGWGRVNALRAIENTPNLNEPFVRATTITIDDATGNNNGMADPGEEVTMYVHLRNLGLDAYNVTMTIGTDDSTIVISDNTSNYGHIGFGEEVQGDGFVFSVDPDRRPGMPAFFGYTITGEDSAGAPFTVTDTLRIQIGTPNYYTWFFDDLESGSGFWTTGGTGQWGLTSSQYHSPTHSMTDSPNGDYPNNAHSYVMTANPLDLSDAFFARITFWARWSLESGYDYVYLEAATDSSDNAQWRTLATYNGDQSTWVADTVDLTPLAGEPQVYIRFRLETDFSVTRDGFYFDDFEVQLDVPLEGVHLFVTTVAIDDSVGGDNDGVLDPGETANFLLTLFNMGTDDATGVRTVLRSSDPYVTIVDSTAAFPDVPGNGGEAQNINDPLTVMADPNTPLEHTAEFTLEITADGGYQVTRTFSVVIGQIRTVDPAGPDAYGYYAYDDIDVGYTEHPVFDWLEIAPAAGGPGVLLPMSDDDRVLLLLPWPFSFYGVSTNMLWVCSNGWVHLGADPGTNDFSNSGIPDPDGPPGMFAGYWDDLNPSTGGQIAWYYDTTNGRFIIEWYQVPHFGSSGDLETFQIILLDPSMYPSATGDGEFLVQFQTDPAQTDFTLGIEDPSETIGLQYYFDGTAARGAAPVVAGRAIKFTTDVPTVDVAERPISVSPPFLFEAVRPNPVTGFAQLAFSLPTRSPVVIKAYDISGRMVQVVLHRNFNAGRHVISWDTRNLPKGLYFLRLEAGNHRAVRKAVVVR